MSATPLCFMDDPGNFIGEYESLNVLTNDYPITSLHLLLVASEHEEELKEEDLRSALSFSLSHPEYLVFHNMRRAGASRPEHIHFQAVLRDELLPIEITPRQKLFAVNGAIVSRVEDYPAASIAVAGEKAAHVGFSALQEIFPTPFNLVLSQGEVVIVPRAAERPSGFTNTFGGFEMAGCVVLVDEEHYQKLTYQQIQQALSECGWLQKERELEQKLYKAVQHPSAI